MLLLLFAGSGSGLPIPPDYRGRSTGADQDLVLGVTADRPRTGGLGGTSSRVLGRTNDQARTGGGIADQNTVQGGTTDE